MVAMLLGLVLIAGAVSVYVASSQTYSQVEQVAALSENGRFGLQVVTDALRHTGFFGRVPAGRVGVDADIGAVSGDCVGAAAAYDVGSYLVALRSNGAGAAAGCVTDAVPDTDVLVIKHAIPRQRAYADCDPDGPPVARGAFLLTNDIRGMQFDCQDGAPTITIGGDIPDGTLWEYQVTIFYIRDAAVPTLARKTLAVGTGGAMQLVTEELVEGVENLHLLFGFDSAGDGEVDSYATAADMVAGDWGSVESLEIHLLLRAAQADAGYTNDKTYSFPGRPDYVPGDNFRRMLLKTRVSLRNPKLVVRGNA
jgi:type IV pilus assembly protein PilW